MSIGLSSSCSTGHVLVHTKYDVLRKHGFEPAGLALPISDNRNLEMYVTMYICKTKVERVEERRPRYFPQ